MKGSSTVNPATETFGQARQGSVAAIIQVLNERLADVGIRTRAVVADGALQLLCEADTADKLEQTRTVERVRKELEAISPQRIKRVKINSRIVREEQLLWLEEINRDPENALLWSETITLRQPFFLQRWIRDRHLKPAGPIFRDITVPETPQGSFSSKAIGAVGLAALLVGVGWLFREDLGVTSGPPDTIASTTVEDSETTANEAPAAGLSQQTNQSQQNERTADTTPSAETSEVATESVDSSSPDSSPSEESDPTDSSADTPTDSASSTGNASDAFAQAVRIASQAAADGQSASTAAEWLDLAARWQKASDLMSNIPEGNEQYAIAQDRIETYQNNSQSALQQAAALQNP